MCFEMEIGYVCICVYEYDFDFMYGEMKKGG